MASAPTRDEGTSLRPAARSSASISSAAVSAAPAGTGRRVSALRRPGRELVAIELLAGAVALDDDQAGGLDALVGGEPHRAGRALAATPDRGGVIEVAGVDDAGLALTALGAAHRAPVRRHHYGVVVLPRGYHYMVWSGGLGAAATGRRPGGSRRPDAGRPRAA